ANRARVPPFRRGEDGDECNHRHQHGYRYVAARSGASVDLGTRRIRTRVSPDDRLLHRHLSAGTLLTRAVRRIAAPGHRAGHDWRAAAHTRELRGPEDRRPLPV